MTGPPTFVVHTTAQIAAVLRAAGDRPARVVSAPAASAYLGAAGFRAMVDAAAETVGRRPAAAFLDCGDRAGDALAALREGVPGVIFTGRADVAAKLAAIAEALGVAVATSRPTPAADLLDDPDPAGTCRSVLHGL
jgi:hypothetical protein